MTTPNDLQETPAAQLSAAAVPLAPAAAAPPVHRHERVRATARTQFEKWAVTYDRSLLNELIFFPSIRICQEEIYRWQAQRGGGKFNMLDVGCGTGTLLTIMAQEPDCGRLVGLDYSPEMVRRAARKFAESERSAQLHAVNGDSERLPFADQSFDVITCCNSFHHYPHQASVLRGFRRVLRPGGLLVLIDGFRDNVIGWVIFDFAVATAEKEVHHASWLEVRQMVGEAGFSGFRQRKQNVLVPLLVTLATA